MPPRAERIGGIRGFDRVHLGDETPDMGGSGEQMQPSSRREDASCTPWAHQGREGLDRHLWAHPGAPPPPVEPGSSDPNGTVKVMLSSTASPFRCAGSNSQFW